MFISNHNLILLNEHPANAIALSEDGSEEVNLNSSKNVKHSQYVSTDEISFHFTESLVIMWVNIRSLNKNFDQLHDLIYNSKIKPDIIAFFANWATL